VLDGAALGDRPDRFARALFEAGVDWIQLRDRSLCGEALAAAAAGIISARDVLRQAGSRAGVSPPRVFINKRVDVALATGADGVHLGGDALSPSNASRLLPETSLLGASFHSGEEIAEALGRGLAYGHLAPIWDPRSKPAERSALGLERLSAAAAHGLPLFAQGGLDAERAVEAIQAGAAGIAVTGLLTLAEDPVAVAQTLRNALDRATTQAG
jgi:thiamine-phosphate pyrophosphorylase